jgi:hypothetical protein
MTGGTPQRGPADRDAIPSVHQLLRATMIALTTAVIVLVVAVLPAEYGIDPTGFGRRIGLLRPAAAEVALTAGPTEATPGQPVVKEGTPFRTDEMTLTLPPGDGAEIKAWMTRGRRFVFSWSSEGGVVNVDMHGEPIDASEGEFTSYWKDEDKTAGHGAFEAPFDGTHGWFWENLGPEPVTIRLRTSGYYDKLGRP